MKFLIIFLSVISIKTYASNGLDKIQNIDSKYLLVIKNNIATKCFKINPDSMKALKTYKNCDLTPSGRQSPLEELKAECFRGRNTLAYFFDNKKSCESAKLDLVNNGI